MGKAELDMAFGRILDRIEALERTAPVLVGIDGRCASGKTGLAAWLAGRLPCNMFHMDDFYLPPEARPRDWEQRPGGNMDLARFRAEVLAPAAAGEPVYYRPFDCRSGSFQPAEELPSRPFAVVEGSYAHHPALGASYGLRIFLTCSRPEQARRLRDREGDRFQNFTDRWVPMEERYFEACAIEGKADIILDTTHFFEEETT